MAKLLTPAEVGDTLSTTPDAVIALIRAGRLRGVNVSLGSQRPRWRIAPDAVEDFIEQRTYSPPAQTAPQRRRRAKSANLVEYF